MPAKRNEAVAHRALHINLRRALAKNEFELHYQPIVEIESGEIATFEALLRWRDPQHRGIGPSDFIPLAERTGLIKQIGEWVLHEACNAAVRWPSQIKVSVNVSSAQFQNASPFEAVCKALAVSGLPPERLALEVTESILLQ
jgi:EAL domain-containing protein (putative c-di-GMP-specific phosphodiesterase class I)